LNNRRFWLILTGLFFIGLYHFTASPVSNDAHTLMIFRKLTFLSAADISLLDKIVRKLAHLTTFGILALLIRNAFHPNRWSYPGAWLLATLYGASDELHQMIVPGRTPLFTDVMIDSLGACLILCIAYRLSSKKESLALSSK
jgi:VanZ family protein